MEEHAFPRINPSCILIAQHEGSHVLRIDFRLKCFDSIDVDVRQVKAQKGGLVPVGILYFDDLIVRSDEFQQGSLGLYVEWRFSWSAGAILFAASSFRIRKIDQQD